jgi:hypothetical protein
LIGSVRAFIVAEMRLHGPLARWPSAVPIIVVVILWGATLSAGIAKNLVGTFNAHDWGRYLFAIGAALTHSKYGIGGYVIDVPIEQTLQSEGLTGQPQILERLGRTFPENLQDARFMQQALERANGLDVPAPPPGDYRRLRGTVGDDVGLTTFARLAFLLFGLKVSSIFYTYFTLLAAAILMFCLGHYRSPGALTCLALMLLAVFLLVISNLMNQTTDSTSIEDPRFIGTLAGVAALHLLVVWSQGDRPPETLDSVALVGQALIFAFCLHVRWPLIWLVLALGGAWIVLVARDLRGAMGNSGERPRSRRTRHVVFGAVFFLIAGGQVILTEVTSHPLYRIDGDVVRHPFWHHVLVSLESHPGWNSKYLATVNGATSDAMPAEVARQEIAKLPVEQRRQYLMRIDYPTPEAIALFARRRFFEILLADPTFVMRTFVVDNPRIMWSQMERFYGELPRIATPAGLAIPVVALALILSVFVTSREARLTLARITPVALVLAVVSLTPLIIATATELFKMIDHFLWALFALGLLACRAVASTLDRLSARGRAAPS